MGSTPILPEFQPITIATMLNLYKAEYRAEFKINSVSIHVNKALVVKPGQKFYKFRAC